MIAASYENSLTHWHHAISHKKVSSALKKPLLIKRLVKTYAKKNDSFALIELGKLVVLLSTTLMNQTSVHAPPQPPLISVFVRSCIAEIKVRRERKRIGCERLEKHAILARGC